LNPSRSVNNSSFEATELLGILKSTLYRWKERLEEEGPRGFEPKSRRPKRERKNGPLSSFWP